MPPRSPTSYSVVAPYSPSGPASDAASAPQATASTVDATVRASVSSSSVTGVGPLSPTSASTHTLSIGISDHLQLLEEGHDALRAVALVHHDLSRPACLGVGHVRDLLPAARRADQRRFDPELAHLPLFDALCLRRHAPLHPRLPPPASAA